MNLKYRKTNFQMSKKLVMASVLLFSVNASAEIVLEHSANVEAGAEYHSNIQYLEHGAESVYVYSLVPQYQIKALDGVNEWFGRLGVSLARSSNSTVFGNREDPFATIGWRRSLENGMFGLTASYVKESTREAQLFETGLVAADGTSVRRDIIADWAKDLTEKLNLKLQASYEKNDFSGTDNLTEFSTKNVNAELGYKLNEKITPFVRLGATDYRSDERVRYQDLLVGTSVSFTPQFKVKTGAGVTRFTNSGIDSEAVGFFRADYTRQRSVASIALSREVFTTGDNSIDLGDRLEIGYTYALSEKSRLGAGLDFGQNRTGQKNQEFLGFYEYDLAASWLARLSMGLSNIKDTGESSANNNSLGISFTYNGLKF